ncbi:phosphatidylinositol-specific phospholipase C domain-containing protein [Kitasatospora sp. MBT63]|uniref:phosphatidylinositol-specific phospholipase C domain-containing protein n=1 Tax=Kitasatospora sp. MBT63 TaxID=1444768 RepID=UPI00068FBF4B|nr:phosphatidylinositol-specific phospholipase C domain-containing protein [Kitasatospora sp. MBT63]
MAAPPSQNRLTARPLRRLVRPLVAVGTVVALGLIPTAPSSAADLPWAPSYSSGSFNSVTAVSNPDWMNQLPDATGLGQMSIPGTHDTLAIHGGIAPWYWQTQENHGDSADTLTAQLNAGIRAIDIRVRVVNSGTAFAVHHTNVYEHANFDDVLAKARTFLAAHPGETVLMKLAGECGSGPETIGQCVNDPPSTTLDDEARIFQSYIARYPGLFWAPSVTGTAAAQSPTLGQVRGRIVLESFNGAHQPAYGLAGLDTGNISWTECNLDTRWGLLKARLDQLETGSGNTVATTGLSASCPPFGATYADVAGGSMGRQGMNQRLLDYLRATTGNTGIIEMDWPGGQLVGTIIERNVLRRYQLWSSTRNPNGSWTQSAAVPGVEGRSVFTSVGPPVTSLHAQAVAGLPDNRAQIVAVGTAGGLWTATRNTAGAVGAWQALDTPGAQTPTNVAVTGLLDGSALIAAVTPDHGVYVETRRVDGTVGGFQPVPGQSPGSNWSGNAVALAAMPDGSTQVISIGRADGTVYLCVRKADGSWGGWSQVPGFNGEKSFLAHDLAIAALPDGSSQIVALGPDNLVYHQARSASGAYTGFARMGGYGGASIFSATSVSIAGMSDGSSQVVAVGVTGFVYHDARNLDGSWTGWAPIAGPFGSAYTAGSPVSITALPNRQSVVLTTAYSAA